MSFPSLTELIPHRDVMLMVDDITAYQSGHSLRAQTKVNSSAFWVEGHFPGNPVMPGVIITESLAQCCAAFMAMEASQKGPQVYLLLRSDIRFLKPVKPNCLLEFDVALDDLSEAFSSFKVKAFVDGECCARGQLNVACRPVTQEVSG